MGFGSPHPHHAVVEQDGLFRVRALRVDEAEARASNEAALKAGESWMPEHYYALGKPTGPVALEAQTLEALVKKLEALEPWPQDW